MFTKKLNAYGTDPSTIFRSYGAGGAGGEKIHKAEFTPVKCTTLLLSQISQGRQDNQDIIYYGNIPSQSGAETIRILFLSFVIIRAVFFFKTSCIPGTSKYL